MLRGRTQQILVSAAAKCRTQIATLLFAVQELLGRVHIPDQTTGHLTTQSATDPRVGASRSEAGGPEERRRAHASTHVLLAPGDEGLTAEQNHNELYSEQRVTRLFGRLTSDGGRVVASHPAQSGRRTPPTAAAETCLPCSGEASRIAATSSFDPAPHLETDLIAWVNGTSRGCTRSRARM